MIHHHHIRLHTGVELHYVEGTPATISNNITLLLVHGFPDTWFGWRHQLLPLIRAGYRCIVPDMRGYGESKVVSREASAYCMENICDDICALLDELLIDKVLLVGHDWGGSCVWNFALHFPVRTLGVISLCTPFYPNNPSKNPWIMNLSKPGRFDYQIYFQTDAAEQELDQDAEHSIKCLIRSMSLKDTENTGDFMKLPWRPTQDGGALAHFPHEIQKSDMLTDSDLKYYAWQFKQSGFIGPVGW